MQYSHNAIYTYISNAVDTESRPVYCTGVYEPVPAEYPACYIHEVDHRPMRNAIALNFEDEQRLDTWEVQVGSNLIDGALDEAREIMADVESAFKKLYFVEISCRQIPNTDPSVTRIVAQFSRVYGNGDQMPDFN